MPVSKFLRERTSIIPPLFYAAITYVVCLALLYLLYTRGGKPYEGPVVFAFQVFSIMAAMYPLVHWAKKTAFKRMAEEKDIHDFAVNDMTLLEHSPRGFYFAMIEFALNKRGCIIVACRIDLPSSHEGVELLHRGGTAFAVCLKGTKSNGVDTLQELRTLAPGKATRLICIAHGYFDDSTKQFANRNDMEILKPTDWMPLLPPNWHALEIEARMRAKYKQSGTRHPKEITNSSRLA